jgi:hypothetical protein
MFCPTPCLSPIIGTCLPEDSCEGGCCPLNINIECGGQRSHACILLHDGQEEHPHECRLIGNSLMKKGYEVRTKPLTNLNCGGILPVIPCEYLILFITCHGNKSLLNFKCSRHYIPYLRILRDSADKIMLCISACQSGCFADAFLPYVDFVICSTCDSRKSYSTISNLNPKFLFFNQLSNLLSTEWVYDLEMLEILQKQEIVKNLNDVIKKLKKLNTFRDLESIELFPHCTKQFCEKLHISYRDQKSFSKLFLSEWNILPSNFILRIEISSHILVSQQEYCILEAKNMCTAKGFEFIKALDYPYRFRYKNPENGDIFFEWNNHGYQKWYDR